MRFALLALGATLILAPLAVAEEPAPTKATAKYEVGFLTDMIDHHAMAVHMAEMCLEKAVHEELRSMCQSIITSQSQEISLMQSWLQEWYGLSHEPEMTAKHEKDMARLASLQGADFEVAFMEMMVKHHESAVREGTSCQGRAFHVELRDMCAEMVRAQAAEIDQMEAWLCQWYERC